MSPSSPNPAEPHWNPRRLGGELALISTTVLFLELALIRWGGAQVRVLAYFPNLLLIGSFLGLGIGCLRVGGRPLDAWWLPALLLFAAVSAALSRVAFTQESVEEHLWLLYYDLPTDAPVVGNVWMPVVACFVLSVLAFIPPGQMVAERLRQFQRGGRGLAGYAWDLGGSVLGTALFAIVSFLGLRPLHWFGLGVAASTALLFRSKSRLVFPVICGALLLIVVHRTERAEVYSPYYALSTDVEKSGDVHILANGSLHQRATNMGLAERPSVIAEGYHWPFRKAGHRPRRALVLGAGSGNDVAALLDEGAESIDAVEIDPAIIELGRKLHPNRPYDSPRVRIINTDARAFLNDTDGRYDTIVFGTLDSMTRLSALSNVRLDNFVYTTECLAAARRHLTDDGALILYFMAADSRIELVLAGILTKVFGETPVIHRGSYALFNVVYLAGPAFRALGPEHRLLTIVTPEYARRMLLPSDDWPFLYLEAPRIGGFYLIVMGWIAGLALAGVALASREFRRGITRFTGADAPMFLFGLGFLLLETRAVTAMNLIWGSTWLTSAVVFGAILLTVLLGTLVFRRLPVSLAVSTGGLVLSLLALYLLPSEWLLTMNIPTRLVLSLIGVGLPVFFAATGFARIYNSRADAGHAFGWNLLGAVAGGLLEFSSMIIGLRALLLLALVAYLLAFMLERRKAAARSGDQPKLA